MVKFTRGDGYVRYDFKWYGFGFHPQPFSFKGTLGAEGWQVWINSYVTAPIYLNLLTTFGYVANPLSWFGVYYSGSIVNPYANWSANLGRLFVGGRTPEWQIRRARARDERDLAKWGDIDIEYDN